MTKKIVLAVLLFFVCGATMAEDKLSKYAKVYKGREGITVTLLPILPKDSKMALIQVKGIDSELDGLILKYKLVNEGTREAYQMQYDGRTSTRLRTNQGYWGKWTSVYLPDVKGEFSVGYDEKASKALDIEKFKTAYEQQEKKNVQQDLAVFKREKHIKYNDEMLEKKAKQASDACGTKINASIDWKSVSEENLKELSIGSYCGAPLENLAYLCKKSDSNKKTLASKVTSVNCTWGEKVHLGIADKTLKWITTKDTPNQDDFAKYVLMNEL